MKNIWILNHYAALMYFDKGGRHYSFAKYLKQDGYNPTVFCCNSIHNGGGLYFEDKDIYAIHNADEIEVPFVFISGRPYIGNGKARVLNMLDFTRNVIKISKKYAQMNGKPDLIYASSVHPLTLYAGIKIAKSFHIKCICEVRDLWPESIIEYGIIKKSSLVANLLYAGEKWLYRKANALVFTLEGGYDYIVERGWSKYIKKNKFFHINNGVDLEQYHRNVNNYKIEDIDFNDKKIFKAIYVGSIRAVNDLDSLLDAAKEINKENIKFLIWGSGDKVGSLKQRVVDENIKNVVFKGKVEKKYIPYILSQADICLMHVKTSQLYKYGLSLNKSFEYLASGKPIIATLGGKYNYVVNGGAGFSVSANNPSEYAKQIEYIYDLTPDKYKELCDNALALAKKYDYPILTRRLEKIINRLL